MINPKFAIAMIILLFVLAGVAGYSLFGTAFAHVLQTAQTAQPTTQAAVITNVPTSVPQDALTAPDTQEQTPTTLPDIQLNTDPTATTAPASDVLATEIAQTEVPVAAAPATEAPPTEAPAAEIPATRVPPTKISTTVPPTRIVAAPTATPEPVQADVPATGAFARTVNGKFYDAYVDAATKLHQYYHYTCEFDAAWVVLKTNGIDATLDEQIAIVGLDTSIEPTYEQTAAGYIVHGGDILNHYSGDYKTNFLARSTGNVIRRIFEHYGLTTTAVHDRDSLEAALQKGQLVWIKTTADFKPGKPVTWIMPDGSTYDTVLGNDHAVVVMGYSDRGPLIRDVLGPTSTNANRTYEYEVTWDTFMAAWAQQQYDGIAVGK